MVDPGSGHAESAGLEPQAEGHTVWGELVCGRYNWTFAAGCAERLEIGRGTHIFKLEPPRGAINGASAPEATLIGLNYRWVAFR